MRVSKTKRRLQPWFKNIFYLRALLLLKIQLKAINIYLHFVSKGVKQLHSQKIGQWFVPIKSLMTYDSYID